MLLVRACASLLRVWIGSLDAALQFLQRLREQIIVLVRIYDGLLDDKLDSLPEVVHVLLVYPVDLVLPQHHGVVDLASVIQVLKAGHFSDLEWLIDCLVQSALLSLDHFDRFLGAQSFHVVRKLLLLFPHFVKVSDGVVELGAR